MAQDQLISFKKLGELLLDLGKITQEQLDLALKFQEIHRKSSVGDLSPVLIGEFLLKQRVINESVLQEALKMQQQINAVKNKNVENDLNKLVSINNKELFKIIPVDLVKKYSVFPVALKENSLKKTLFLAIPFNTDTLQLQDELQFKLGIFIKFVPSDRNKINEYIEKFYPKTELKKKKFKFFKSFFILFLLINCQASPEDDIIYATRQITIQMSNKNNYGIFDQALILKLSVDLLAFSDASAKIVNPVYSKKIGEFPLTHEINLKNWQEYPNKDEKGFTIYYQVDIKSMSKDGFPCYECKSQPFDLLPLEGDSYTPPQQPPSLACDFAPVFENETHCGG